MVERILRARDEPHLIDQLRVQQLVEHRIDLESGEQIRAEVCADHRCRCQRALGLGTQPIDAGLDGRLHRGRHAQLGDIRVTNVVAALAAQHTALRQLAHHLLGEERIPSSPVGDDRFQFADGTIRAQQVAEQC